MSEEIKCYVCGHGINEHIAHQISSCVGECRYRDFECECINTPQEIAAYAVAQAYEQGRIDYGGGDVDALLICADRYKTDPEHKAVAGQA